MAKAWLWLRRGGKFPSGPDGIVGNDKNIPIGDLGVDLAMAAIYSGVTAS